MKSRFSMKRRVRESVKNISHSTSQTEYPRNREFLEHLLCHFDKRHRARVIRCIKISLEELRTDF